MKNNINENEYIDLNFSEYTKLVDDRLIEVKKIALHIFKEKSKNKKEIRRIIKCIKSENLRCKKIKEINKIEKEDEDSFEKDLDYGMKRSIDIVMEYSKFMEGKTKDIDKELENLLKNKILKMNYKSKCNLNRKIKKEIIKEYERFKKIRIIIY